MKSIVDHIPESILAGGKKQQVLQALEQNQAEYSVRLNSNKISNVLELNKVTWCKNAYYIQDKPRFSMDPLWHSGAYYVQEAGSMFLETLIEHLPFEQKPQNILDLCAAPGGKTTLLANCFENNALIVANEILPQRLKGLHENIIKWGLANVICSNNHPKAFERLPDFFDLILVDAPCSGEGLLRRHEEALNQWSEKLVEECAVRQKEILSSAIEALKPGGFLIYSTCTYNTKENEDNLAWLLGEKKCVPVDFDFNCDTAITITETMGCKSFRFFPGITRSEGFYVTVVQKQKSSSVKHWSIKPPKIKTVANPAKNNIGTHFSSVFIEEKGNFYLVPEPVFSRLEHIKVVLNITLGQRPFGSVKNGKFIPDETLGFLSGMDMNITEQIPVDYKNAVLFLSKNNFSLETQLRGFRFLCYKKTVIGLVNCMDSRINNYYPNHWRLLNPDWTKPFSLLDKA